VNLFYDRLSYFPSVAIVCTEKPFVDPISYITALER